MLIPNCPALGVFFNIDLLADVVYGEAAWTLFLNLVDVREMARGGVLFSGDTMDTLGGQARDYCIAIQHPSRRTLATIRRTIAEAPRFRAVNPSLRFAEDKGVIWEPLPEVGFVTTDGKFIGFPASSESHWFIRFDGFIASPDE